MSTSFGRNYNNRGSNKVRQSRSTQNNRMRGDARKRSSSFSEDVGDYLTERGFVLQEKLITPDDVSYIRAVDPVGNIVAIKLDTNSYVSDMRTTKLLESTSEPEFPEEMKRKLYNIICPSIRGAIVICTTETCIIYRDDDEVMKSAHYSSLAHNSPGSLMIPIVSIGDVRTDIVATAALVENVSGEIMNTSIMQGTDQVLCFKSAVEAFSSAGQELLDVLNYHIRDLTYKSDKYHNASAKEFTGTSHAEKSNTVRELQQNDDKLSSFLLAVESMSSLVVNTNSLVDNVEEFCTRMKDEYGPVEESDSS